MEKKNKYSAWYSKQDGVFRINARGRLEFFRCPALYWRTRNYGAITRLLFHSKWVAFRFKLQKFPMTILILILITALAFTRTLPPTPLSDRTTASPTYKITRHLPASLVLPHLRSTTTLLLLSYIQAHTPFTPQHHARTQLTPTRQRLNTCIVEPK